MSVQTQAREGLQFEELIPASHRVRVPDIDHSNTMEPFHRAFEDVGLQDIVSQHAAHGGLVHRLVESGKPVIWVQDHASRREFGAPSLWHIKNPALVLHTPARNARDALWAMEEAVKSGVNVVGEIMGSPRVLDFTATRRLEMFSRAAGVRCFLVRTGQQSEAGGSSGARWRWRVDAAHSATHLFDTRAPGSPRWLLELLRARSSPSGKWTVETDEPIDETGTSHRLRVVPPLATGDVAACEPSLEAGEEGFRPGVGTGNVVALRRSGRQQPLRAVGDDTTRRPYP